MINEISYKMIKDNRQNINKLFLLERNKTIVTTRYL